MPAQNLTESQAARQARMREVALELALDGGWDAVQMREVAARAEVALGTLYRYFPSKENLLLSVMLGQVEDLADRLAVRPPEGADAVERVSDVLRRANRALARQPQVTTAMIRALVSGNTEVAPVVADIRVAMRRIITDALGEDVPDRVAAGEADRVLVVDLLSDIWLAALVSWLAGVETTDTIVPRLLAATRLLLA